MDSQHKNKIIELVKFDCDNVDKCKDPEFLFYSKSMLHKSISQYLIVKAEEDEQVNFEKLCDEINKRIGGRSTIYEVLQDGLARGYFNKYEDAKDKRLRLYTLSETYSRYLIRGLERCFERVLQTG